MRDVILRCGAAGNGLYKIYCLRELTFTYFRLILKLSRTIPVNKMNS